jgi:hypothetical protein
LKGGALYYTPLSNSLSAFDKNLLIDPADANSSQNAAPATAATPNSVQSSAQSAAANTPNPSNMLVNFDPEFLSPRQVLNLINNFISQHFINSEINVNDLIVFIKDNYAETALEKNAKLEKVSTAKKSSSRTSRFSASFDKLDNECSGQMNFNNLVDALVSFKDGLFKEQVLNSKSKKLINQNILNSLVNNYFYLF